MMVATELQHVLVTQDLTEASFDDAAKEVVVRVIQAGWSGNGRYYSKGVAESFAEKLLASRKTFADHKIDEQTKKVGRSLLDWAATVQEAWAGDGMTMAKLRMTTNPRTSWFYDEAKAHPSEVGLSIDAQVRVNPRGEAEGRTGHVVEEVLRARADFVAFPSAGGHVMHVLQAMGDEEGEAMQNNNFPMSMMDVKAVHAERQKASAERDKLWDVWSEFNQVMQNIHHPGNPATDEDKSVAFDKALTDLRDLLSQIDWSVLIERYGNVMASCGMDLDLFGYAVHETDLPGDADVTWTMLDASEGYTFSDASWGKVDKATLTADDHLIVGDPAVKGTWHLPYKVGNTIYKGALRAISTILKTGQFRGKKIMFGIPQAVREKVERLLKAAKIGEYAEAQTGGITHTEKGENTMTDEEIRQAITELFSPLTTRLAALEQGHAEIKTKQAQIEEAERVRAYRQQIEEQVSASRLPKHLVSPTFVDMLMALPTEKVAEAIAAQEAVVFRTSGKPTNLGVRASTASDSTNGTLTPGTASDEVCLAILGH
jgi:hypothetical protein